MVKAYDPQVDFRQGGVGEPFQVDVFRTAKVFAGGFADGTGELGASDAADPFRLQGDSAGNMLIASKLRTVPCDRVGGDDKCVVLLVPGIEARCTPGSPIADGGYAQQVVPAEEGFYSFVKCWLFQLNVLIVSLFPAALSDPAP